MTTVSGAADAFDAKSLKANKSSSRNLFNIIMTTLAGLCIALALVPLVLVLFYVFVNGANRLDLDLFTQLPPPPGSAGGGISNAISGTIIVVAISTLISVPIGVLCAIWLAEFGGDDTSIDEYVRFGVNMLAGVPSIIAGVFIYGIMVRPGRPGYSALAGGVALAVLMLPTIIRTTDEALKIVPQDIRWASLGVGASKYQTVLKVVLPAAIPSILTGVTLAIARAAGETAPLIFTALFSPFRFSGIDNPIATLAVLVYNFAILPFKPQQELAWAASLILVLLVLITSIIARIATRQKTY
ncbi:phosphate ABC transporter permease PstA [Nodosilinea sp. LEGE 07088]|uniref:phosphate ABC transporter permease PstA n=1 Tax=Nodosilinea sp. LEGE 07088 TaxID=2777968 RepID=UPI00187FDF01|nr:phosphate ABC transporter permease PstA [Nodosilinea sp. LEGE 07088]MBE9139096.1 phosphate ABC transporter permease PstA [Nodosilinea sp. LEGE 07088]